MIGSIQITEWGATPGLLARVRDELIRKTLALTAANHHEKYMWRHFEPEAYRRYGYTPRTKQYVRRKLRVRGHNLPLVWSGESRTLAKIRDVRATKSQARLVQHARGLNRRKPTSQVKMNEEIRTMADVEQRAAIRFADQTFHTLLKQLRDKKTTRVG